MVLAATCDEKESFRLLATRILATQLTCAEGIATLAEYLNRYSLVEITSQLGVLEAPSVQGHPVWRARPHGLR
jgi:hypothetical protein